MKKLLLMIAISMMACISVNAQKASRQAVTQDSPLRKLFNKHVYTGQYPLPPLPVAPQSDRRAVRDASSEPLVFPDRVWFPGEWEEVKAIVVSLSYSHYHPEHLDDICYLAEPVLDGWAAYYYQKNSQTDLEFIGFGPYETTIDLESENGVIPLLLIDGIQQGGAEAWVRIEVEADEALVREALEKLGLRQDKLRFIVSAGNSVWFRDCGPICFYYGDDDNIGMLDFLYGQKRAMDDKLPSVIHRQMGIPNYISKVVWEGGNCLVDGVGGLVTSSAIYANNSGTGGPVDWDGIDYTSAHYTTKPALTTTQTKTALHDMLGQRETTVLPRLNFDGGTGHLDLYADAIDENGFLFSKMPDIYSNWSDYDIVNMNVSYMLQKPSFWGRPYYDMGRLPFPALNNGSPFDSEESYGYTYARTYANHAIVNNVILQPCFSPVGEDGMPTEAWDRANIETLMKFYPGYQFYCIDMRKFDGSGGSVHCITKQIPADNPIRILHKTIHGNVNPGTLTAIPFSAIITNKSGIKEASLTFHSSKDDNWCTVPLTPNGNRWSCDVNLSDLIGNKTLDEGVSVQYYFQATSNNGKTITKPLNAASGNLFTFTLTSKVAYDEQLFDFSTEPIDKNLITFKLGTAYLTEDTSTDQTTVGISEVTRQVQSTDNQWYTISGMRLATPPTTKGIYVHNGHKVAIK